MEASRAHYADLYDFAPVGFASLDRAGIVRDINLTGAHVLGHDRAGLLGLPVLPLVAKPDRAKWLKHLASLRLQPQAMVEDGLGTDNGAPGVLRFHTVPPVDARLG